ncbi:unnamed protein product [Heterobilharzia americana]|nr:unnamed protein product [Heterobilharzia americana]
MVSVALHYFVITLIIAIVSTFFISYIISASDHHISILFPYISDTGALPPESCVFGQLLNICSFLCLICVYSWYLYECDVILAHVGPQSHIIFARVTCIIGCLSAIGMSIVANFQEATVLTVHLIGALMVFGFGTVFSALVTYSTRKYLEYNYRLFILRGFLTILSLLLHIGTFAFAALSGSLTSALPKKWDPTEKGYTFHALSAVCEWFLAVTFLLFFTSMIYELRNYVLKPIKIRERVTERTDNERTPLVT